jgi:hypothetical protein
MGRPPGTGGPPETIRRNRVVVMLTDGERATLNHLATSMELPPGTVAYRILARALRRTK